MKRIIAFVCAITLIISSLVVTNAADTSTDTDVKVIGIHQSSTKDNIYIVLDSLPDTDTPGSTTYSGFTVDVVKEATSTEILPVSVTSDSTIDSCVVLSIGEYLSEAVDYDLILTGSATDTENNGTIAFVEELNIHIDSTGKVYEVMSTDLWPGTNHDKNLHHAIHMQSEDLSSKLDGWSEDDIYSEEGDATEFEAIYLPGFKHVTSNNFSMPDGEYKAANYGQLKDSSGAAIPGDLDKTLLSVKVKFTPSGSQACSPFVFGGDNWHTGFGFYPNNGGTAINIVNLNNKTKPMTAEVVSATDNTARYLVGVLRATDVGTSFNFKDEFILQISFEYTIEDGQTYLTLNFYVNGKHIRVDERLTRTSGSSANVDALKMKISSNKAYHGNYIGFDLENKNGTLELHPVTPKIGNIAGLTCSNWALQPISTDDGVFRQLSDGTEEAYASTRLLLGDTDWMQLYFSDRPDDGPEFDDGTVFYIKGAFEIVDRDDKTRCYHDTYNKAVYIDEKYQWKNGQWNLYEHVAVDGVYKDSKNGIVNLRMSSLPNASDGATPVVAEYSGLAVEIFDGTDTNTYSVSATADTTKNLTMNLSDYMDASKEYKITLKACTYVSNAANADFSMNITEDFTFYQDKSSGLIYEEIGSTRLIPGKNFSITSGLYVTGTDYTGSLPGFVFADEKWTIYLKPFDEESGIFRKSLNGEEKRLKLNTDYGFRWPTNYEDEYCLGITNRAEGDIFTVKGKFQVVKGQSGATYKDYHKVLVIDEVQYQYKDGKWKWVSDTNATVNVDVNENIGVGETGSIYLNYQDGSISFGSEDTDAHISAFETDSMSGIFVNDIKKSEAYLTEAGTDSLCVQLPVTVVNGDKVTLTGGFTHPTDDTIVTYAETSFWYGEDIVQNGTEETISTWYEDFLGKSKTEADMNGDGELDVLDIVRMKRWYGNQRVPVKNTQWIDEHLGDITHQSSEEDMMAALCDRILEMGDYMDVMPIGASKGPVNRTGTAADAEAEWGTETHFITDYYYQLIADAGINTIRSTDVNYKSYPELLKLNLEMSAKYGLGYYVTDSYITDLAESTKDIDISKLAARIAQYSSYPAYRGVNVVDEPTSSTYNSNEAKYISKYTNLMTALNSLNVDTISCVLPWNSHIDEKKSLYDEYVDYVGEYCDTFKPKLLGYDHYPFTRDTAQGSEELELDYYFGNMSVIRDHAVANGIPFGGVVQAGGNWNDNGKVQSVLDPFPMKGQFHWNVNTYLAFGAKSISYFPLIQPWGFANATDENENETRDYDRNGLIGGDGETNQWYDWAKEINQHIGIIDEVLMNSEFEGLLLNAAEGGTRKKSSYSTYEVTNLLSDFVDVNSGYIVNKGIDRQYSVTGYIFSYSETSSEGKKAAWRQVEDITGNAVVGCFDFHGKTALYVVNYDMEASATIKIDFDGAQKIKKVQKAKTSYETIEAEKPLELSMDAGEGVLIVIQ